MTMIKIHFDDDDDDVGAREIMIVFIGGIGGLVVYFAAVFMGIALPDAAQTMFMSLGTGLVACVFIELRALRQDVKKITRQPTCGCAAELKNCDG